VIFSFTAAWHGHTEESRLLALDIALALDATYDKRETAAADMGLHPADLSRQLAGRDPLNMWRLTSLTPDFWIALLAARSRRLGAALITPEQLQLLKGAAVMGPRKMARMLLSTAHNERRVG
jgi:hypothetical protein